MPTDTAADLLEAARVLQIDATFHAYRSTLRRRSGPCGEMDAAAAAVAYDLMAMDLELAAALSRAAVLA